MKTSRDEDSAGISNQCGCPNGSYGQKHTTECYEAQIERLRGQLDAAEQHVKILTEARDRLSPETSDERMRSVLVEVRRRVHQMKERHIPGLFTDEMARLGELMGSVLGSEI